MTDDRIPAAVTENERWIVRHSVCAIKVEHVQTGTDTSQTYVVLTPIEGKSVRWTDVEFRKVACLKLDWIRCVEPNFGVREKVEAREKWEKANARELSEYKRLKAKFGTGS